MRSKRTTATDITPKVREAVKRRDNGRCIICGFPYATQAAHIFINRSHGGLGVEENLALLCLECHMKLDNGRKKESRIIREYAEEYLKEKYPGLKIDKLKFKKGNET